MLFVSGEALEESDDEELDNLSNEHDILELWYLSIMVVPEFINFPIRVTMDSYLPAVFGTKFRFRSKEDMQRLMNVWRLPDQLYFTYFVLLNIFFKFQSTRTKKCAFLVRISFKRN